MNAKEREELKEAWKASMVEDKKNNYVSLRIKKDTHQRFKVLAAQLGMSIDEAANLVLNEYERSTAQGRRFAPRQEGEQDV